MRHVNQTRLTLFLVLALALAVTAGCGVFGGAKQASTPAAQAILDADAKMHAIAVDHMATATSYFKGCTATPRAIDITTCNKWDTFDTQFRKDYRATGMKLETVKTTGAGQSDVDAAIAKLTADLAPYKR